MPELQRLRADHAEAVLAFELANRAYFAAFISDRGDEFYDQFAEQHHAMLAEQEAGACAFHVLVSDDGTVIGRFNLFDLDLVAETAPSGPRQVVQAGAGRAIQVRVSASGRLAEMAWATCRPIASASRTGRSGSSQPSISSRSVRPVERARA